MAAFFPRLTIALLTLVGLLFTTLSIISFSSDNLSSVAVAQGGFGAFLAASSLLNLTPGRFGQLVMHCLAAAALTASSTVASMPFWTGAGLTALATLSGCIVSFSAARARRNATPASLKDFYQKAVSSRRIRQDQSQREAVAQLDQLGLRFLQFQRARGRPWGFLYRAPTGVYLHGPAGRGKSFLLDAMVQTLPATAKRRYHYHEMMSHLLEELHQQTGSKKAIRKAAKRLANPGDLVFIDELNVLDLTGARILIPLIEAWWQQKTVLCVTSNRPLPQLFTGVALEADEVAVMVKRFATRCAPFELAGAEDYRANKLSAADLYQYPVKPDTPQRLQRILALLAEGKISTEPVALQGQIVECKGHADAVAWFEYAELCNRPLGYRQYLDLVARFPTLMLSNVPKLTQEDPARRFAWLVESIYDAKQRLVMSADVPIDELFAAELSSTGDTADFGKISSRLLEMQSSEYNYVLSTETASSPEKS